MKLKAVYKITNPEGKIYIGSSVWAQKRLYQHSKPRKGLKSQMADSVNKYGWASHKIEYLCICNDEKELRVYERHFQELYNVLSENGLNDNYVKTETKKMVFSVKCLINKGLTKKGKTNHFKGTKYSPERLATYRKNLPNVKRSTKMVFNYQSGIFYDSIVLASKSVNINPITLSFYLNGDRKNKTYLILC